MKYFDLDRFLEDAIDVDEFKPYPEILEVIQSYRDKVKSKSTNFFDYFYKEYSLESLLKGYSDQAFMQRFTLGENGELGFFHHTWDIGKLKKIIRDFELVPVMVPTTFLYKQAVDKGINVQDVDPNIKNSQYPIVVDHPLADNKNGFGGVLVDGNHRVISRYKNKKMHTLIYRLNASLQLKGLDTEIDVFLYKLISNMFLINTAVQSIKGAYRKKEKTEIREGFLEMLYPLD